MAPFAVVVAVLSRILRVVGCATVLDEGDGDGDELSFVQGRGNVAKIAWRMEMLRTWGPC